MDGTMDPFEDRDEQHSSRESRIDFSLLVAIKHETAMIEAPLSYALIFL